MVWYGMVWSCIYRNDFRLLSTRKKEHRTVDTVHTVDRQTTVIHIHPLSIDHIIFHIISNPSLKRGREVLSIFSLFLSP